jgi:hypothetical protein
VCLGHRVWNDLVDYDATRRLRVWPNGLVCRPSLDVALDPEALCGLLDTHSRLVVVQGSPPSLNTSLRLHECPPSGLPPVLVLSILRDIVGRMAARVNRITVPSIVRTLHPGFLLSAH